MNIVITSHELPECWSTPVEIISNYTSDIATNY